MWVDWLRKVAGIEHSDQEATLERHDHAKGGDESDENAGWRYSVGRLPSAHVRTPRTRDAFRRPARAEIVGLTHAILWDTAPSRRGSVQVLVGAVQRAGRYDVGVDVWAKRSFVSEDGHRVGARHHDADAPLVVFLPALGVPLGFYSRLLAGWAAKGYSVLGIEHRGMPLSPVRRGASAHFGYSTLMRKDLAAVFSSPEVRQARTVLLVGHSMGGALALLATAAGIVHADAVVTVATGSSWCGAESGVRARVRRFLAVRAVRSISWVLGRWPGERMGFAGNQPAELMRDWGKEASIARFELSGDAFDYEGALRTLHTPHLMLDIKGDKWVSPRAVRLLARRAPLNCDQRRITSVSDEPLTHFSWAHAAPDQVIAEIAKWSPIVPR